MKRLLLLFLLMFVSPLSAVTVFPAANVKYVSDLALRFMCGITNNAPDQSGVNMSYLLKTIDICNAGTTTYGTGQYATNEWASTDAVNTAMSTLLKVPTLTMSIDTRRTSASNRQFSLQISASGKFIIDWGDGTAFQIITKADTNLTTYTYSYMTAGAYTIRLVGRAKSYNSVDTVAAINFYRAGTNNMQMNLIGIAGNLGYIFPIINETATGKPRFYRTFYGSTNLIGSIPANLFSGISGAPATSMFYDTFNGCVGLTGSIPSGFFSGINGSPTTRMFSGTFSGCSGLTGAIPSGLFSGINGVPAANMFYRTFNSCTGITGSIPVGIFGNLSGTAQSGMFYQTFYGCAGLTGQSALIPNGITHLYQVWTNATNAQVGAMYRNDTGLADYTTMPNRWR